MIGVGAGKSTKDEFEAAVCYEVVGEGNLFATKAEMSRARDFYPKYQKAYRGVISGSLENVSMPDIILFPVRGRQMCMITTAYTYQTGEIMAGYGGSATCMITVGLHSWRIGRFLPVEIIAVEIFYNLRMKKSWYVFPIS